jgi:putative hydrolase of the HAD superfamily
VPVDAVLFDLDDTLLDWTSSIHRTVTDLADERHADRLLAYADEHCCVRRDGVVVNRRTWQLHEFADDHWPKALPELSTDEIRLALGRFRDELWVGFFPDVVPVLDQLVDRYRLGLLSNNPYVDREVERLRLGDWFEVVIEVDRDLPKPHPDAFRRACSSMGVELGRTAHVGDSITLDAEAAAAAGLVAVWIDRHDDGWEPTPPIHRIKGLAELPALLDDL